MMYRAHRGGMGTLTTAAMSAGAQVTGAVVGGNTSQIISSSASGAGAIALALLPAGAATGPIGLAITAAVIGITALSGKIAHLISGCGQVCVNDTNIVTQADQLIQQVGIQYWATPVRTLKFQAWTLQQLAAIFDQVRQAVGLQKSATERLTRGGGAPWCAQNHLAIGVDNVVSPTPTNVFGRCGGWLDVVYDPIANDPNVVSDDSIAGIEATMGLPAVNSSDAGLIGLALVALAVLFL